MSSGKNLSNESRTQLQAASMLRISEVARRVGYFLVRIARVGRFWDLLLRTARKAATGFILRRMCACCSGPYFFAEREA